MKNRLIYKSDTLKKLNVIDRPVSSAMISFTVPPLVYV